MMNCTEHIYHDSIVKMVKKKNVVIMLMENLKESLHIIMTMAKKNMYVIMSMEKLMEHIHIIAKMEQSFMNTIILKENSKDFSIVGMKKEKLQKYVIIQII